MKSNTWKEKSKMTKLCVISPKYDLFASLKGDMVFVQADWIKDLDIDLIIAFNELRGDKELIIDNQHPVDDSTVVDQVTTEELMKTARDVHATEVIIPDIYRNAEYTLLSVKRFFDSGQHTKYGTYNYMFVPQGDNVDSWRICLATFLRTDYAAVVKTIGVPKWLGEQRPGVIGDIPTEYMIHFLGVRTGWGELEYHPRVRSWDTSLPYAMAQRGLMMSGVSWVAKYTLSDVDIAVPSILDINIKFAKALLTEQST